MKLSVPIYDLSTFEQYKNQGVYIGQFGAYSKRYSHLHAVHGHSFYHMVYFSKGNGIQHIDFKPFEIKPGQVYFMIPGQVHITTEPEGYIVNFSKEYFSSLLLKTDYLEKFSFFKGPAYQQVFEIEPPTADKLTDLFEEILKEGALRKLFQDDLVKILLLQLFMYINRTHFISDSAISNPYNHTLLKNFQSLIDVNFTALKFPKQYAALLHITPNHLNALCKDLINKSAGELIRERIILEAKRMLINIDYSVAEIAGKLNFTDLSYFIKFFKKYEEVTPEKFRKFNT
ncbi:AraC-like DNA-binding protein [Pedobacter sp. CAN_A7]|uniref:AraC family transcriptional regulator n=1 Tax=Pedobacter sp. CAN_A7 TaxID=2787722 RepID=UPI0018C9B491